MNDLIRKFLLPTILLGVLCTMICPSARGGTLSLFTTTIISDDRWNGEMVFGPATGAAPWLVVYRGEHVDSTGIAGSYSVSVETVSSYAYEFIPFFPNPGGIVKVGITLFRWRYRRT